jgi:hypothetical protein
VPAEWLHAVLTGGVRPLASRTVLTLSLGHLGYNSSLISIMYVCGAVSWDEDCAFRGSLDHANQCFKFRFGLTPQNPQNAATASSLSPIFPLE